MGLKDDNQKLRQERDGLRSTIQGLRVTNLGLATELGTLKKIIADAMAAERDALDKGHRISVILAQRDAALARAEAAEKERDEAGQTLCEAHPALWTGDRRLPQVARDFVAEVKRTEAARIAEREAHAETRRQLETANLTLRQFVDFVRRERALRDAHGKGGQHTGASPRISPSVLHELERFIAHAPGTVEWVGDKLTAAEARLRAAEALVRVCQRKLRGHHHPDCPMVRGRQWEGCSEECEAADLQARLAAWLEGRE